MRWLILFLLAVPAHAQTVEIAGGSSTLYQSSGAGVLIHFPNSETSFSAGEFGGHFGFSAAESHDLAGWAVTIGDRQFSATAGTAGLGLTVRGLSASRGGLTLFLGGTGPSYASPFFSSASAQHIGAGAFYRRKFEHGLVFDGLGAIAGSQRTAIGSLGYDWRAVKIQGSAGMLQNARYWAANLSYEPAHWANFSGARTTYQFGTVNSAGASVQVSALNFHASAFQSARSSGQAFGAGARFGPFELRADEFRSRYGATITGMLGERISRRFSVQEFISESGGHKSFNCGGTYTSNRFALSVSQQTYFMPLFLGRAPFQQSLAVQLSFRLPHDSAITLATNLDPTGKLRWGAYGTSYAYGGWQPQQRRAIRGGVLITGTVHDKSGMPVSGAAISIGGQIVYSDSTGAFTARVKHSPAPVAVSLDDFSAPGTWIVDSAPARAQPSEVLSIILEKQY